MPKTLKNNPEVLQLRNDARRLCDEIQELKTFLNKAIMKLTDIERGASRLADELLRKYDGK